MSEGYAEVKARLDEIVAAVADESLSLDDALALYEEAVTLGGKVSALIETDIAQKEQQSDATALAGTAQGDANDGVEPAEGPSQDAPAADGVE